MLGQIVRIWVWNQNISNANFYNCLGLFFKRQLLFWCCWLVDRSLFNTMGWVTPSVTPLPPFLILKLVLVEHFFKTGNFSESFLGLKKSNIKSQASGMQFCTCAIHTTQVLGRLFAPSQKSKKLSHQFRVCFELGIGILNGPRKIFLVVYEPILKLQGLVAVEFQGKNCFKKMASNISEIDCGFR